MGWSLRKSFKFGAFRINLSNSGISTSFGVKGARINFSKRGTFLNLGGHGIYYRQKLNLKNRPYSGNTNSSCNETTDHKVISDGRLPNDFAAELQRMSSKSSLVMALGIIPSIIIITSLLIFLGRPIETNNVYQAWFFTTKNSVHIREIPSLKGRILATVNSDEGFRYIERTSDGWSKIQLDESRQGFIKAELGFVQPKVIATEYRRPFDSIPGAREFLLIGTVILLTALCIRFARYDKRRRTLERIYPMDENLTALHSKFLECFNELSSSKKIWNTIGKEETTERKYNAGASQLVHRVDVASISNSTKYLPFVRTNVSIPHIALPHLILFFFPDQMVLKQNRKFVAIQYKELDISIRNVRFIETDTVPIDATIVDYTWEYLNKNGEPDLRFSNNRKLPICLYTEYTLRWQESLYEIISTSKTGAMTNFSSFLNVIGSYQSRIDSAGN